MVRLKEINVFRVGQLLFSFNSNMVRLKDSTAMSKPDIICSFNSNMVRLKDKSPKLDANLQSFQFQYGAIKRKVFQTPDKSL